MIRYIFLATAAVVTIILLTLVATLPRPSIIEVSEQINPLDAHNQVSVQNNLVFTNVRVFNGVEVLNNQTLTVSQGKISGISPTSQTSQPALNSMQQGYLSIDGSGLTIMPGIIDAHTHTYGNGLNDALRFGVSTHLDMFGTEYALHDTRHAREAFTQTSAADLYSAGTLATVAGGHGTQFGFAIDTLASVDEIAPWVTKRKDAGADYIKLVYSPYGHFMPSLSRELAKEIINESHLQGMQVLAHISTHRAAQDMIEDGIDGLVHIFADKLASDELVALAKQNDIFIVPTLAVIASAGGEDLGQALVDDPRIGPYLSAQQKVTLAGSYGAKIPGFDANIAKQNVKRFFDAGVPILSGSDAPNPGTAYGISALHETVLLVEAGLSPVQALMAATSEPARLLSLGKRGVIEVGARADLLLVGGDPTQDIPALYNIKSVYKNGFEIPRAVDSKSLVGDTLRDYVLGEFLTTSANQSGLATIDDFSWAASDDSMANGDSAATIEVVEMAGLSSTVNGVLKVTANVNTRFAFPWAGAAVGDFTPPIKGIDMSALTHLVFDIKGSAGTYRVMSFDAASSGVPPSQTVEVSEQWQTLRLPLAGFAGTNLEIVSGFAFVAGPDKGEFLFYLDNVRFE